MRMVAKANLTTTRAAAMLAFFVVVVLLWALFFDARPAHAKTFTVNSTGDTGDEFPPDKTCDSDPTAAVRCTLREAIDSANANNNAPTIDTIKFNIPTTELNCNATSKVCTIFVPSGMPQITEPLTIDGYSQPGSKPNALTVGNNAVLKIQLSGPGKNSGISGLKIEAANSTVKGLVISNWDNGVFLDTNATGNTVRGNYIGTDTSGAQPLGNNIGVVALGDNNTIGGTTAAARNIISDNGSGVQVGSATGGNKVVGNYIGTNAMGTEPLGNTNGVVIDGTPNNTIGGTTAGARNTISGNSTFGIRIAFSGATDNKVQGNYIGTNAMGTETLANGSHGVSIQDDASNNTIGGTTAGARNIISGNGGSGVEILDDNGVATGNSILRNSIYANDALGIDLVFFPNDPAGVTNNDDGDFDAGPNNLQNFPDLDSAKTGRRATTIKGTLNSTANTTFTLQFFGSPEADDPSGFGEGQRFRFQKSVTTDDSGDATFTFKTRKKVPKGQVVTATATNQSTGDTSEFSLAITAS